MGWRATVTFMPQWKGAMKIQEVILRAMDGRLKWYHAAEILGISDRQMRRWKLRYERFRGMLLFVAPSIHRWIPSLKGMQDLIVVLDDATTEVSTMPAWCPRKTISQQ